MAFSPDKTDINHVPDGHLMPRPWFSANNTAGPLIEITRPNAAYARNLYAGERKLGNFILPAFQRPPVWTQEQQVRFIESIWQRLPLGAYIVNRVLEPLGNPHDNLLLDGQQRITAILAYVDNAFPVMGYYWRDLSRSEQRGFEMVPMPYLETKLTNMDHIKEVYDRLAYGGTPHEPKDADKEVYWEVVHTSGVRLEFDEYDVACIEYDARASKGAGWSLVQITRFDRTVKVST